MAKVLAMVDRFEPAVFDAARRAGQRAAHHVYAFDALVAAATASLAEPGPGRTATAAKVIAVIHHAALQRGWAEPGERCQLNGWPVPAATIAAMTSDAFLAAVVTDGVDIRQVVHLGRSVTAHQRTALEVRDPECVIDGCHTSHGLEIDHVDGWAQTGITTLDRLARLCKHHHWLKCWPVTHIARREPLDERLWCSLLPPYAGASAGSMPALAGSLGGRP